MKWLIVLFLLVSCANEPKILVQEKKIPIPVPCAKREILPEKTERETDKLRQGDSIHRKTQAMLLDLNNLDAENLALWAILEGCVE